MKYLPQNVSYSSAIINFSCNSKYVCGICAHTFMLRNLKFPILPLGVVLAYMPRPCRQLLDLLPLSPISKYAKWEANYDHKTSISLLFSFNRICLK